MYILCNLKQAVTVGVNQTDFFVLLVFSLIYFLEIYINAKALNNHIMRTECPINMKQKGIGKKIS